MCMRHGLNKLCLCRRLHLHECRMASIFPFASHNVALAAKGNSDRTYTSTPPNKQQRTNPRDSPAPRRGAHRQTNPSRWSHYGGGKCTDLLYVRCLPGPDLGHKEGIGRALPMSSYTPLLQQQGQPPRQPRRQHRQQPANSTQWIKETLNV